jgi:hypothetical protein
MLSESAIEQLRQKGRTITPAAEADKDKLGPLKNLPGRWSNDTLPGRGWNLIALPFFDGPFKYRLLMNQFNEDLTFEIADVGVPNRGIETATATESGDQFVAALDYQQVVTQIAADDFPKSDLRAKDQTPIHHEPGLFLHMTNKAVSDEGRGTFDIARLGTIPHGDSVLALGTAKTLTDPSVNDLRIPKMSGLPVGTPLGLNVEANVMLPEGDAGKNPYVAPYSHFHHHPFKDLFEPVNATKLLVDAIQGETILETTVLDLDTTIEQGGILNIPFVIDEANATDMRSIFWIHKVKGGTEAKPRWLLQYAQFVFLDFFPRGDGSPGLVRWPHISINTMEKIETEPEPMYELVKSGKFAP